MSTHNDFPDPGRSENTLSFPTRREFLAAVVSCSGALALGLPSLVRAGGRRPALQRQVSDLVKGMRSRGLIRPEEKTSWSVYDLTSRKKLVAINEDIPRQAASMIKPFVAQAYFYKLQDARGKLRYTGAVRKTMEAMIRDSDNRATNRIMAIVSRHERNRGPKDVERVLKKNAPGVFRETRIVESIPPDGRTYRNLASAHDYSRFLYALWHDRMPGTDELREIMSLPNQDRICHGVRSIPDDVKIYDKTGSTARLCGNMGIIEAPGRGGRYYPYIFIGIIERPSRAQHYEHWITQRSDAIRAVSDLVYLDMKQRHQLA
ncbi:serine hydrolase [Candidatus Thiosymbion oneisti]|uniref:serine hydrolase n=1 Tax=Candidatus Thiosymbion oneisti TaxID=589554 RepID=UPI000AEE7DD3|nr:serine hydrolase [Candidatus Thiosymbion oneisti]